MKIKRYSCRCKLCKARFTTTEREPIHAFASHGLSKANAKTNHEGRACGGNLRAFSGE